MKRLEIFLQRWFDDYSSAIEKHKVLYALNWGSYGLFVLVLIFGPFFLSSNYFSAIMVGIVVFNGVISLAFKRKFDIQRNIRIKDDRWLTRQLFKFHGLLKKIFFSSLAVFIILSFLPDKNVEAFLGITALIIMIISGGFLLIYRERYEYIQMSKNK